MKVYLVTAAACLGGVASFAATLILAAGGMIPAWLT
jgi:hypothetical protein